MDAEHPDFTGIWQLDPENSTFSGPSPASLVMRIDHEGPTLTQQILATDDKGGEQRRIFTCRIGEETISAIGETSLHSHAYWQGDELLIETKMTRQGRDLLFKDFWSLSVDGTELTMAHRDDSLAGQTVRLTRAEDDAFPSP